MLRDLIRRSPLGRRLAALRARLRGDEVRPVAAEWQLMEERLSRAKRVVDLGCGATPHPRATAAVDAYLAPTQRNLGHGASLDRRLFSTLGVSFVQADLGVLPFADKAFDFAYASHVFEHLPDPKRACAEMARVAHAGAIVTPSIFWEFAFGRPYHLWFVIARGSRLVFVRKTLREDRAFGEHPAPVSSGGYRVTPETNPFDILLNDGSWYRGQEGMPRLSRRLRALLHGRSPVLTVVFLWQERFECLVVHEDGRVE
jgi:SAM-dependent methyltransferase